MNKNGSLFSFKRAKLLLAITIFCNAVVLGFCSFAYATSYSITYNDGVTDSMPTDQYGITYGPITLQSNTPSSLRRRFLGWCQGTNHNTNITTQNGVDSCSSTVYLPGADVIVNQNNSDKYLYAMWSNTADITFNFDAGISSIVVNGTTISSSGTTVQLPVDGGYEVAVNYATGYERNNAIVNSGDVSLSQYSTAYSATSKYNIYVLNNSTISFTSELMPVITFNFDAGISSINVGGYNDSVTFSSSGNTLAFYKETTKEVKITWKSGYMLANTPLTVTSGDATLNITDDPGYFNFYVYAKNNNSTVNIQSQTARNVTVRFTDFTHITKIVVNGTTISSSGGSVSLRGGSTYTVTGTFEQSDIETYTFDGGIMSNNVSVTAGSFYNVSNIGKNTFSLLVGINNGTVAVKGNSCVTADTLITLSDGTKKRVADLTGDEYLLVWDFDTASYSTAPITFIDNDPEQEYDIIHAFFSGEDNYKTDVEIVSEHGFYDYTLNKFIYLNNDNPEQYIGHEFIAQSDEGYKIVELTDIKHEKKVTTVYSPTTYKHFNYYTNEMLSMPGGIPGMFNYFDVDKETLGYDQEKKQKDIEKYGLLTLEDFDGMIDELGFEAYNGQYLNISIGKGLTTWESIKLLADRYGHFTEEQLENSSGSNLLKIDEGAIIKATAMDRIPESGLK